MSEPASPAATRTVLGVAIGDAILLGYGLIRPESLSFSIPFLIAPSGALLAAVVVRDRSARRSVLMVVSGIVVGLVLVILVNELR